jgi:hypothetical protein
VFDLLMSADMMLSDPDGMADILVKKLGVHGHPKWRQAFDGHPYIAHFLRVHKSLAVAPTRIEPQCHLDQPNPGDPMFHDFLESLKAYQGSHRPMVTHSIVLAARGDKFDQLVEKLMRRRLRFRMAQRTPDMPFDRLWLGATPEDPHYHPSVDGGPVYRGHAARAVADACRHLHGTAARAARLQAGRHGARDLAWLHRSQPRRNPAHRFE